MHPHGSQFRTHSADEIGIRRAASTFIKYISSVCYFSTSNCCCSVSRTAQLSPGPGTRSAPQSPSEAGFHSRSPDPVWASGSVSSSRRIRSDSCPLQPLLQWRFCSGSTEHARRVQSMWGIGSATISHHLGMLSHHEVLALYLRMRLVSVIQLHDGMRV